MPSVIDRPGIDTSCARRLAGHRRPFSLPAAISPAISAATTGRFAAAISAATTGRFAAAPTGPAGRIGVSRRRRRRAPWHGAELGSIGAEKEFAWPFRHKHAGTAALVRIGGLRKDRQLQLSVAQWRVGPLPGNHCRASRLGSSHCPCLREFPCSKSGARAQAQLGRPSNRSDPKLSPPPALIWPQHQVKGGGTSRPTSAGYVPN